MKPMHLSLAVAATLLASAASAQQYTFKVGAAYINPNATSSDLTGTMTLNIAGLPTITKPVDSGIQLEVQPQTAFIFSIARSFNDHWEAEVLLGFPPKHDVKMRMNNARIQQLATLNPAGPFPPGVTAGTVVAAKHIASYDGKVVSTLTQFAPTAFLNYKFGTPQSTWRPYVGVGVNFTHVKPDPTTTGEAFYNDGKVKTKVSDSWGLALQAGVSYHLDDNWLISASYATAQVSNKIEIQTASGSTQYGKYKFNPSIWMFTVGRKF